MCTFCPQKLQKCGEKEKELNTEEAKAIIVIRGGHSGWLTEDFEAWDSWEHGHIKGHISHPPRPHFLHF